jgi:hypothetical protein
MRIMRGVLTTNGVRHSIVAPESAFQRDAVLAARKVAHHNASKHASYVARAFQSLADIDEINIGKIVDRIPIAAHSRIDDLRRRSALQRAIAASLGALSMDLATLSEQDDEMRRIGHESMIAAENVPSLSLSSSSSSSASLSTVPRIDLTKQ